MKLDLPGLLRERMASGRYRYRVRVEGKKWERIALSVEPDDPRFLDHYKAARAGVSLGREATPSDAAIPKSFGWLTHEYERHMREQVEAGTMDRKTCHQRSAFYARLRADYADKAIDMPRSQVIRIRDGMVKTPGAADNMVKAIRALYKWAVDHGHAAANPADKVPKINRGTGATAWSIADMQAFRTEHPAGTMAHLALTLFMFTACRIDDVVRLGRANEVQRDGMTWLRWQPGKRGSAAVEIPMLPPLARAIAAQKVAGPTYLLTSYGQPFASGAAFGNWFRDRVREAGLTDRSPHGIRKAAGELMAEAGASQHQIMAVHGHTQAKTSEIYTRGADRAKLASEAMRTLSRMDW